MTTAPVLLTADQLSAVRRVRTGCTAAAAGGAGASIAANLLASDGTPVGLAVGLVAPVAYLVATHITQGAARLPRVPGVTLARWVLLGLLAAIAVMAAVVSFGHLVAVVGEHEGSTAAVLVAITVDALAVMGMVGHRITSTHMRSHDAAEAAADAAAAEAAP